MEVATLQYTVLTYDSSYNKVILSLTLLCGILSNTTLLTFAIKVLYPVTGAVILQVLNQKDPYHYAVQWTKICLAIYKCDQLETCKQI